MKFRFERYQFPSKLRVYFWRNARTNLTIIFSVQFAIPFRCLFFEKGITKKLMEFAYVDRKGPWKNGRTFACPHIQKNTRKSDLKKSSRTDVTHARRHVCAERISIVYAAKRFVLRRCGARRLLRTTSG